MGFQPGVIQKQHTNAVMCTLLQLPESEQGEAIKQTRFRLINSLASANRHDSYNCLISAVARLRICICAKFQPAHMTTILREKCRWTSIVECLRQSYRFAISSFVIKKLALTSTQTAVGYLSERRLFTVVDRSAHIEKLFKEASDANAALKKNAVVQTSNPSFFSNKVRVRLHCGFKSPAKPVTEKPNLTKEAVTSTPIIIPSTPVKPVLEAICVFPKLESPTPKSDPTALDSSATTLAVAVSSVTELLLSPKKEDVVLSNSAEVEPIAVDLPSALSGAVESVNPPSQAPDVLLLATAGSVSSVAELLLSPKKEDVVLPKSAEAEAIAVELPPALSGAVESVNPPSQAPDVLLLATAGAVSSVAELLLSPKKEDVVLLKSAESEASEAESRLSAWLEKKAKEKVLELGELAKSAACQKKLNKVKAGVVFKKQSSLSVFHPPAPFSPPTAAIRKARTDEVGKMTQGKACQSKLDKVKGKIVLITAPPSPVLSVFAPISPKAERIQKATESVVAKMNEGNVAEENLEIAQMGALETAKTEPSNPISHLSSLPLVPPQDVYARRSSIPQLTSKALDVLSSGNMNGAALGAAVFASDDRNSKVLNRMQKKNQKKKKAAQAKLQRDKEKVTSRAVQPFPASPILAPVSSETKDGKEMKKVVAKVNGKDDGEKKLEIEKNVEVKTTKTEQFNLLSPPSSQFLKPHHNGLGRNSRFSSVPRPITKVSEELSKSDETAARLDGAASTPKSTDFKSAQERIKKRRAKENAKGSSTPVSEIVSSDPVSALFSLPSTPRSNVPFSSSSVTKSRSDLWNALTSPDSTATTFAAALNPSKEDQLRALGQRLKDRLSISATERSPKS